MKIIITGLPLFAKRLCDDLNQLDTENKYFFYNTYYSKLDLFKFFLHLPFVNTVISMNGVSDRSRTLNWVLLWKKKLVLQWMGTDALLVMERFSNKTIFRKYVDYGLNFIDSPWLKEELNFAEITNQEAQFKYSLHTNLNLSVTKKIQALSYISSSRKEFYGLERVLNLANLFPDVQFLIIGMDEPETNEYKNVRFLGWVTENEVAKLMTESLIFLRLTEHDGFSVSVIEALCFGCEVISSLPSEFLHHAPITSSAENVMNFVLEVCKRNEYKVNKELISNIWIKYDKKRILNSYNDIISKVSSNQFFYEKK